MMSVSNNDVYLSAKCFYSPVGFRPMVLLSGLFENEFREVLTYIFMTDAFSSLLIVL